MSDGTDKRREHVEQSLRKLLDIHGYGFQYAVLEAARKAMEEGNSRWIFEVAEFPIEIRGSETRIDFILRRHPERRLLVAECKRANPARSNWCFFRAPYTKRGRRKLEHAPTIVELLEAKRVEDIHYPWHIRAAGAVTGYSAEIYEICREVQSMKDDEPRPDTGSRNSIDEAAAQLTRGLNGLVDFFASRPKAYLSEGPVLFGGVIFTTAELWTSDLDLTAADVNTGRLPEGSLRATPTDWVRYQFPISPSLKHSHSPATMPEDLSDIIDLEYMRTINIVNARAIGDFLTRFDMRNPEPCDYWFRRQR